MKKMKTIDERVQDFSRPSDRIFNPYVIEERSM